MYSIVLSFVVSRVSVTQVTKNYITGTDAATVLSLSQQSINLYYFKTWYVQALTQLAVSALTFSVEKIHSGKNILTKVIVHSHSFE